MKAVAVLCLILIFTGVAAGGELKNDVHFIDRDGDGFGVACPNGPDGDDTDPTVNDAKTVREKYPFIQRLLMKRGYRTGKIIEYNRKSGVSWESIRKQLKPGVTVIFREGVYPGKYVFNFRGLSGEPGNPILFLAWPGERVVFDGTGYCIGVENSRNLVFDGFILANTQKESFGSGISVHFSRNITFRNIEAYGHKWGIHGTQGLIGITIENCVFHDNPLEHGLYIGSRESPNTNINIISSLFYRNGRHGIQHNGRVENLVIDSCRIHSNNMGGISLINGASNSIIRGNTIFNNNKQGIIFYTYDEPQHNIFAYSQSGNLIENNVIWCGSKSFNGKGTPAEAAAVVFNDTTEKGLVEMKDNVIKDNVMVTQKYPVMDFRQDKFVKWVEVKDNILYRADGRRGVFMVTQQQLSLSAVKLLNDQIADNRRKKPDFNDVSVEYYNSPESFDFSMTQD